MSPIHVRITRSALTIQNCPEALAQQLTYTHYKTAWDNGSLQTIPSAVAWAQFDTRTRTVLTYPNALHLVHEKGRQLALELTVDDERTFPTLNFGVVKPEDSDCYRALQAVAQANRSGLIVGLTGRVKTSAICELIRMLPDHFKVLVTTEGKSVDLLATLRQRLGEPIRIVGQPRSESARVVLADLDELSRFTQGDMAYTGCALRDFDAWICDEVHRLPTETRRPLISQFRTVYSWGLTATPQRNDNAHELNQVYFGPTLFAIGNSMEVRPTAEAATAPMRIHVFPLYTEQPVPKDASRCRQIRLAYLTNPKLALILRGLDDAIPHGQKALVFADTFRLAVLVKKALPHFTLVHGKTPAPLRRQALGRFKAGRISRLIATDTDSLGATDYMIDCSASFSPNLVAQHARKQGCAHYVVFLCTATEQLFNHGIAKLQNLEKQGCIPAFMFPRSYADQIPYAKAPLLVELGWFPDADARNPPNTKSRVI